MAGADSEKGLRLEQSVQALSLGGAGPENWSQVQKRLKKRRRQPAEWIGAPRPEDLELLLWNSGGNVWELVDKPWPDNSMGYVSLAGKLGMRTHAGPSGTTNRIIQYARFLGFSLPQLYMLRLAIVGWFVSTGDHSLFEVLLGAH